MGGCEAHRLVFILDEAEGAPGGWVLLDSVLLGGDGEMLGRGVGAVDAVGKANAGKADGVVAMEALGGDLYGEAVGGVVEFGDDLEIFGMAEAVHVFVAEAGEFAAVKVLVLDGIEDKVVAEAGDCAFGFEVAGVNKELYAVTTTKICFGKLLEGGVDVDVKREALGMPGGANFRKGFFIEKFIGERKKIGFVRLEVPFVIKAVGCKAKKLDGRKRWYVFK